MARRFSGMSYDYGGGGGGGFDYGLRAPDVGGGSDDFAEGFAALGKAMLARRAEGERERRSADIYYRQNTKHIPADKLKEFETEFETGQDAKQLKTPEGKFARAENAIKRWDSYRTEITDLNRTLEENAAGVEAQRKAQQKTADDLRRDISKQRSDALNEQQKEGKAEQTYTQRLATQARTTEAARRAAARAGLPPDSVIGPESPDRPGQLMKSVPIYREGDEQGFDGIFEQIEIPKSDARTWLSEEEAAQIRSGGRPATPTSPRSQQTESLVATARPPAPRTPVRNAAQLREAATAPLPAQTAPARRPEAPPHAQPRTAQEIYENTTWNKSVTGAKKAVGEEEKAWTGQGAADVHSAAVLDEYVAWRDANGLPPLDDKQERIAKTRIKVQLQGYAAGPNRGRRVVAGLTQPGEPAFESQQPFGLTAAEKNEIAEAAWEDPNRPYPGFYVDRPARPVPTPQVAPKPPAQQSWYDKPLFGVPEMLGMSVKPGDRSEEELRAISAETLPGAVPPPPPAAPPPPLRPMGTFGTPTAMLGGVRQDDTMTPAELAQYREVQKQKEGMLALGTSVATRAMQSGATREQAVAAAQEAIADQAANIEQQIASSQGPLAAPASRRIAQAIDENLTARNAAKMAIQAAAVAAASFATGGAVLPIALAGAGGNLAGQALLNKPGEAMDYTGALAEGATMGISSKIPLGGIGRALGKGLPGKAVAGSVREGVQEGMEEGISAVLQGRPITAENIATSAILGAIYGPMFEVALGATGGGANLDAARATAAQAAAQAKASGASDTDALAAAAQAVGADVNTLLANPPAETSDTGNLAPPGGFIVPEPGSPAAPFGSPAAPVSVPPAPAEPAAPALETLQTEAGKATRARRVRTAPAPPAAGAVPTEGAVAGEEAPTGPPASPETSPDFRAWVDQMLGPGSFAALEAQFRTTGDASGILELRQAHQQALTGGGDPGNLAALADIQPGVEGRNAVSEMARQYEQQRLAAARLAGPATRPGPGHYTIMRGPDGQFYVATVMEPDVTRREAEGETGPGEPGSRAIMGPFREVAGAETAAGLMNQRFTEQFGAAPEPGSLADIDPQAVMDWERQNAREVFRGAPPADRRGGKNIGSGRRSPAEFEPGTAARLKAEADAATATAAAAKATGGKKRAPRKRNPRGAAPPAAPAAAPLAGVDSMLAGLQAQAAEAEKSRAAQAAPVPESVAGQQDDAGVMADINAAVDRATSAEQLAGTLEITPEEAQVLIDGRDAEGRGPTAMSDPFGAGLITGIMDSRAIKAKDALMERLAQRQSIRAAAGPAVEAMRQRKQELDADPARLLSEGKIVQGEILRNDEFRRNYGARMVDDTAEAFEGFKAAANKEAQTQPDPAKRRVEILVDTPTMKVAKVHGRERALAGLSKEQFLSGVGRRAGARSDPRNDPNMTQEELEVFFDKHAGRDINGAIDRNTFEKLVIWTPDFGVLGLDGVVNQMGGPDTTRRAFEVMRALSVAAKMGARFEKTQAISPDTAKLYNNLWTMTGIPASRMPGMNLTDILNQPGVAQYMQRFNLRERGGSGEATAMADPFGLQTLFNAGQKLFGSAQSAASGPPGPKAARVGRALVTGPRSTLEHLSDLGPSGKHIADLFQIYRDAKETLHGRWSSTLDKALRKVPEDQRGAFVDLLEGRARPTTPETTQAVTEARGMLDEVARYAQTNERFIGYLADYFPRIMADRPSLARKAKAAALDMWQDPTHKAKMQAQGIQNWSDPAAASYAAAVLMFPGGRGYGAVAPNLEKHRTGLLQEYRTDPEVLYQYIGQAAKAISHAMAFDNQRATGPTKAGKSNERYGGWKEMWGRLAMEPGVDEGTSNELRAALERELGIEQAAPTNFDKAESNVRDIVASTSLALSFLNQPQSFSDTAATLGLGNSLSGLGKLKSQEAVDAAVRAGSVRSANEARGRSYAEEQSLSQQQGASGALGDVAKFYRDIPWMNWMQQVDRSMRITADAASRASLDKTVESVKAGDQNTLKLLKAAGVDPQSLANLSPADVQAAMSYGQMTPAAQTAVDQYARRMVELTQQRARPGDLPKSWSTPRGQWMSMFMPFKYRQMKSMLEVFKANPGRFIASGLPAYIFLGATTAAMRAVLTGYGVEGEENDEQTTQEKFMSVFGNRPIRPDSPEDLLLRVAQTMVRSLPTPMALTAGQRFQRAGDAGDLSSAIMGPVSRVIQAGAAGAQGVTGRGRPTEISPAEWAARGLGTGAALALGPSAYGYQVQRELMGPTTDFPRKSVPTPAAPGLVGRLLDLKRGETTVGQTAKGVTLGGPDTVSKKRKKRRENIQKNKAQRERISGEARTYETMRGAPAFR